MAGKYTPTKHGNLCEIWGNTSGKCLPSEIDFGRQTAILHLCMEYRLDAGLTEFK